MFRYFFPAEKCIDGLSVKPTHNFTESSQDPNKSSLKMQNSECAQVGDPWVSKNFESAKFLGDRIIIKPFQNQVLS